MTIVENITISSASIEAARASFSALSEVFATPNSFSDCTVNLINSLIVAGDNAADLVISEPKLVTAFRAGDVQCFEINPADWYLELCSAIASDSDLYTVSLCHGWPVLSVGGSTVTKSAGESISCAGGSL